MNKLQNNIFYKFNTVEEKIAKLESTVVSLQEQLNEMVQIQRSHLIKVKNNEFVSDDTIFYGLPYEDLSPYRAYVTYSRKDFNFIFLDVSDSEFSPSLNFEDVLKIPLENLAESCDEFLNKKVPIMVISEDGTKSMGACEILAGRGYYNISNVSGGYKFRQELGIKI